jgi:prepilin-type N-terminal cleavage/methylation domain-containing protein
MRLLDSLRARVRDEAGFTLVELVTTCAVMGVVMAGTVNILVSGERASSDGQARLTAQQNIQLAFTRLEYDARCASSATLLNKSGSNGAGVYISLPSATTNPTNPCSHASGDVTWCVTSGSLVRTTGTTCSATTNQDTFISSVTSSTPFSCYSPVSGSLPQLKIVLGVNSTTHSSDAVSGTDYITLHNATSTGCA